MWAHDLLGIAEDADTRAIKRAYAARLKVTRPDEDAVAFQRLVAARDVALAWAAERRSDDDETSAAARRPQSPAAAVEGLMAAIEVDRVLAEAREAVHAPPGPRPPEPRPPEPAEIGSPRDDGAEIATDPVGRIVDVLPETSRRDEVSAPDPVSRIEDRIGSPPEPPPGPPPVDPVALGWRIDDLFARGRVVDLDDWRALLAVLDEADVATRARLEAHLARSFDRTVEEASAAGAAELWRPALALAAAAFGWSRDVRRVARLIDRAAETSALVRTVDALVRPTAPPRRDASGFPLIDGFDLDTYFEVGRRRGRLARLLPARPPRLHRWYREARDRGRFPPFAWSWTAALFPTWWLVRRGHGILAFALTMAAMVAIGKLTDFRPSARLDPRLPLLGAGLLAGRILLAAFAARLEIRRLARLVDKADRTSLAPTDARRAIVAARFPGSRLTALVITSFFLLMVDVQIWSIVTESRRLAAIEAAAPRPAPPAGPTLPAPPAVPVTPPSRP